MKKMKNLLILLITVTFISCGQTTREIDLDSEDKDIKRVDGISLYKDTPFTGTVGDYSSDYSNNVVKITTYKDGKKDGLYEKFFKDGDIQEKIMYKNGEKDGLSEEIWYRTRKIKQKSMYKNGNEDLSESYYEDGQLKFIVNSKNGKNDGPFESYYENGQLEEKTNYKDGKRDGPYESYYEDGKLKKKTTTIFLHTMRFF